MSEGGHVVPSGRRQRRQKAAGQPQRPRRWPRRKMRTATTRSTSLTTTMPTTPMVHARPTRWPRLALRLRLRLRLRSSTCTGVADTGQASAQVIVLVLALRRACGFLCRSLHSPQRRARTTTMTIWCGDRARTRHHLMWAENGTQLRRLETRTTTCALCCASLSNPRALTRALSLRSEILVRRGRRGSQARSARVCRHQHTVPALREVSMCPSRRDLLAIRCPGRHLRYAHKNIRS